MEALSLSNQPNSSEVSLSVAVNNTPKQKPFIEANTVGGDLGEMKTKHLIPVFNKDGEPLISQVEFIEAVHEEVHAAFPAERILEPQIRLSHPILGRVPEARDKPARELEEHEKTIHYERMAFVLEIASIREEIEGETLALTVGGIKAYNEDNLYNKKGAEEHFKIFIGFQVKVCTNLCVWTDGYQGKLKVKNLRELKAGINQLITSYDAITTLQRMSELKDYALTEQQFAHLIGRCRMYQFLSSGDKRKVPELLMNDSQIGTVCRDYYRDRSFSRQGDSINLWRLYNLLTNANKSTYIDSLVDKNVGASEFVSSLATALKHKEEHWFLN